MSRTTNLTTADALFKHFYAAEGSSLQNPKAPLASLLMKNKKVDFVGDQFVAPVRFGSAVGLGYRSEGEALPTPVTAPRQRAVFPAKKAYGTVEYSREAIVASRNDKGAFAKVTVDEVEAVLEGFMLHNVERALFGNGSGVLGEINGAVSGAGTSASPWSFALATSPTSGDTPAGKKQYFPQGAPIDVYSAGGVYQMTVEIVSATESAGVVTVTATTKSTGAAVAPASTHLLYWEGSKDKEIVGLKSIAPISAGSLYGISQSAYPKFKGLLKSISGALQFDDINDGIEELAEESMAPNLAVTSHSALSLLKNLSEDQKRYNVSEVKTADSKIGFKGVEAMSSEGPFPVIASQMCPKNEIWLLNTKCIQLVLRQDFGWFDDDGTVLMRDPNKDIYSARYGGYFEMFCSAPNSIMRIYGFTL
jgi:hypothetical protein